MPLLKIFGMDNHVVAASYIFEKSKAALYGKFRYLDPDFPTVPLIRVKNWGTTHSNKLLPSYQNYFFHYPANG